MRRILKLAALLVAPQVDGGVDRLDIRIGGRVSLAPILLLVAAGWIWNLFCVE